MSGKKTKKQKRDIRHKVKGLNPGESMRAQVFYDLDQRG